MPVIEGAGPAEGKERVQQMTNEQNAKRRQAREEDQKELRAEKLNNVSEGRREANNQIDASA